MLLLLAAAALAACSPARDWRELQPEGSGAIAMFPCRPTHHERDVPLAGAPHRLALHACTAGDDATYALAVADVGDPARVGEALRGLRDSAAANVGAGTPTMLPLDVRGATPNADAGRAAWRGTRSDGRALEMQVGVFAKGTRVYQATVLGEHLSPEAVDTFFAGLRTP